MILISFKQVLNQYVCPRGTNGFHMEIFQRPIIKTVLMYFINTIASELNNVLLLISINLPQQISGSKMLLIGVFT